MFTRRQIDIALNILQPLARRRSEFDRVIGDIRMAIFLARIRRSALIVFHASNRARCVLINATDRTQIYAVFSLVRLSDALMRIALIR